MLVSMVVFSMALFFVALQRNPRGVSFTLYGLR
jgi:hypothetical protein